MKLQYLGDSKDSFKWDYHDCLVSELGYPLFNVALMMTPDDQTSEGSTRPSLFPARPEVVEFCKCIREARDINAIKNLPKVTGSSYAVELHKGGEFLNNTDRMNYFSGLEMDENQLLFVDPDNGFEPEKSFSEKHVLYSDIDSILGQLSDKSVISVFQHSRRKPFSDDFARIRERLLGGHATAIYWSSLMFVQVSNSEDVIERVAEMNARYADGKPVSCIR